MQFDQGLTGSLPANFDYQVSSGGLSNHAGHAAVNAAEFKALLSELGIIG